MQVPRGRCTIDDQGNKLTVTIPTIDKPERLLSPLMGALGAGIVSILCLLKLLGREFDLRYFLVYGSFCLLFFLWGIRLLVDALWLYKGRETLEISEHQLTIQHQLFTFSKSQILLSPMVSNFQVHPNLQRNPHSHNGLWDFKTGRFTLEYQNPYTWKTIGFGDGLHKNEAEMIYQVILDRFPIYRPNPGMTLHKSKAIMMGALSQFLNRQRYRQALPYIQGSVLDIGCGYANLLAYLPRDVVYVGVDGGPNVYRWLLKNRPNWEFHRVDLDKDTLALGRKFDTVVMLAVIEHLTEPQRALCQIIAHLNLGGRLIITTPSPMGNFIHSLGARVGLFSQYAADDHEIIFTRDSLQTLLENCGLRIERYQRFLFSGNQIFICFKHE